MSQMDPFCTAWHVVSSQTQLRAATHKHPEQQARGKPSSFTYDRQFEIANARQAQQQRLQYGMEQQVNQQTSLPTCSCRPDCVNLRAAS